jgi:D-amino-acid dehydrogenase
MQKNQKTDVLIIGGGLIGLACAHFLIAAGRSVTVLERSAIGAGASYGNCGLVTPSHGSPLTGPGMVMKGLKSMLQSDAAFKIKPTLDPSLLLWLLRFSSYCNRAHWERAFAAKLQLLNSSRLLLEQIVKQEKLDCDFYAAGSLTAYRDQEVMDEQVEVHRFMENFGINHQMLTGSQLRERMPELREGLAGGMLTPGDAHVRPDWLTREWAKSLATRGVKFMPDTAVDRIEHSTTEVSAVHTKAYRFAAQEIVLATGSWSPLIAKGLGVNIPIQPGKGYSITMPKPAGASAEAILLKEVSVVYTPWSHHIRLGSTMEFVGYDDSLNEHRLGGLVRGADQYMKLNWPLDQGEKWCGWRPMVYDELPMLGRAPKLKNLSIAAGHGMLGLSMCAGSGKLMAEIICGKSPHIDATPYDPARFA